MWSRLIALVLMATLGCAETTLARPREVTQRVSLPAVDAARWQAMVERLEPAAFISVRTRSGRRQKGTVVTHDAAGFSFQPRTRIPVPPVVVRYDDVVSIERSRIGLSPGQKVLIGAGSVVGGTLVVMAILFASFAD